MSNINHRLQSFTPYQLILGTLTIVYALRHLDDLLGIGAPEPLAKMYSRSYYRATYVNTALDAGFASAMAIRPKWLKDICSLVFGVYYLMWATEGDEVLRRYRALCSVEMLRTTWEKTFINPYLRGVMKLRMPKVPIVRYVYINRPPTSSRANNPPVKAMLLFNGTEKQLARATELVMDFPGGGFIAMGPECHEERLRTWAIRTGKPILSIDYGKAPEYPYPWAIEEGIDAYRTVTDTKGAVLGIKSRHLGVVLTGDSAGGNICTTIMNRILEHHKHITRPVAMILAYPALDFNFTSWMSPNNLRVLQTEQSEVHIPGLVHGKDHLRHKSPLSVVDDVGKKPKRPAAKSRKSWADSISATFGIGMTPRTPGSKTQPSSPLTMTRPLSKRTESGWFASREENDSAEDMSDVSSSDDEYEPSNDRRRDADKSLAERVKTPGVFADERFTDGILSMSPQPTVSAEDGVLDPAIAQKPKAKAAFATRLTMTSRVGYFQDRVISPSMMRAMAILYIGPQRCPDFETDYYISPLLSPAQNLAHFPPVYLICGERDPFVDDTVIFAGKLREAKRTRRAQAANSGDKSAKYGEGLRMTTGKPNEEPPDHILRETDEDWVQMRIIEGWGHGFMQMSALMREVDPVLVEMADWIDESFERARLLEKDKEDVAAAHAAARAAFKPEAPVTSAQDSLPSPLRSRHVKPVREYTHTPKDKVVGESDLGMDFGRGNSDDEGSMENIISFTPKTKKRTPPPSQFNPVPRRPSRDVLKRDNSAINFDSFDDTGSSGETVVLRTPPQGRIALPSTPAQPKGTMSFGLFSRPTPANRGPVAISKTPATSLYAPTAARRASPSLQPHSTNPIVKAAVAGARAASPALQAAGLVPQSVNSLDPEEMYRRRRAEAVFGMETDDASGSDK
jgi:acetyl esterase/lipase